MVTTIINRPVTDSIPEQVSALLPYRLTDEIRRTGCGRIEEIRIRRGGCASLTCGGQNILLDFKASSEQMDSLLMGLCSGSMYAHTESIKQGYVSLEGGIRAGVCGRAAVEDGRIIGVNEISSVCIRLPHDTPKSVGAEIASLVRQGAGVLIYSPPGVGKTTVLRGAAALLASGSRPLRVAVVDTRWELGSALHGPRLSVDILSGYPRRQGIEIASRTLGAQVIVCDEIGDAEEASSILSAHNCGVPLLASAHGMSMEQLMKRPGIAALHAAHVFGWYVGLERRSGADFEFEYQVADAEAADAFL